MKIQSPHIYPLRGKRDPKTGFSKIYELDELEKNKSRQRMEQLKDENYIPILLND